MTTDNRQHTTTATDGFSVIIAVHDQAEETERNLPLFLQQQCNRPYEVIVVDDSSADETPDALKRIKAEHERLYTTFLPKSVVFNPSRKRLALNVGIKAAHYSWIVLADINCPPPSEEWLPLLESCADGSSEVLLMYSGRRSTDVISCQPWDTLQQAEPLILKGERHSGKGHSGRLMKFSRGHYDAIAVTRSRVFDVLHLFDQPIAAGRLLQLRCSVFLKNLFNRA